MTNSVGSYEDARKEHARILTAYEEALKAEDRLRATELLNEGERIWQCACDMAPDEDSRTELNRAMNRILAFAIAVELKVADEARRLYDAMPLSYQQVIDDQDAQMPGSMKIWVR